MLDDLWQVNPGQGWGVIQLGSPRAQTLQRLSDARIEFEDDEGDPEWVIVDGLQAELTFQKEEPCQLLQIAIDNPDVQLNETSQFFIKSCTKY